MRLLHTLTFLSVFLMISTSVGHDMTLALVWRGTDDLSDFQSLNLGRLAVLRVGVNVNDNCNKKQEIGRNTERRSPKFYYTNDNVPSWVTGRLVELLKQIGMRITGENPDIILNFDLLRFYVDESSTYKGDVGFRVSVSTQEGANIWTGLISGNSSRWGSSFSAENFLECISNSLLESIENLLKNEDFISAVNRGNQPQINAATGIASSRNPSMKKRIAVFDFEDKTHGQIRWWRSGQGLGQGLSDMCVTALLRSTKYTVVEREKLAQLMSEQALGATGALTEETAVQIGRMLGVDIALFGAVTEFGYKEKKSGGNAPVPTPFGMTSVNIGVNTSTARVAVDVRLVNTTTGEIIAAETISADESNTDVSISDVQTHFANQAAFDQSLVGIATRKAIDNIIARIDVQSEVVEWYGNVVSASGSEVIINAGSNSGIRINDTLFVFSKGKELIDPATGLSLGFEETRIGAIIVMSDIAQGRASKCTIIEGTGGQRGDIVRFTK